MNLNLQNEEMLINNIHDSIKEYISERNPEGNKVLIGQFFCEWVLKNVFELREDEVIEATEIAGQYDNGIDAVFTVNDELHILQSKYNTSHNLDAVLRFKDDCLFALQNSPITKREIVFQKFNEVKEKFENGEKINCFYVTNKSFTSHEQAKLQDIKSTRKTKNVDIEFVDILKLSDFIDEKTGRLPREFRDNKFNIIIGKHFEVDDTTIITEVTLKNFAEFMHKVPNTNLLFHSNIRNYLKNTKINRGISSTLSNESAQFWYFNNGITIVCSEYVENNRIVKLTEPQIVNGCQTARTISKFFIDPKNKDSEGRLLLKIIRTKRGDTEDKKKQLRDDITRFTNSQNAVRGLDFYALEGFQRDLQNKFSKLGYYYEIQRGSFVALNNLNKQSYKFFIVIFPNQISEPIYYNILSCILFIITETNTH